MHIIEIMFYKSLICVFFIFFAEPTFSNFVRFMFFLTCTMVAIFFKSIFQTFLMLFGSMEAP
jgi:hypothetical protein